jgi:hypothetical protein
MRKGNVRVFNDRIKLIDGNSGLVRFVKVDDDGDIWIESDGHNPDRVYIPKALAGHLGRAVLRALRF